MGFTALATTALLAAPKALQSSQNYQSSKNTARSLNQQADALEANAQQQVALTQAQMYTGRQNAPKTLARQESERSLQNIAPHSGSALYAQRDLAQELEEQLEQTAQQALGRARELQNQAQIKSYQGQATRAQGKGKLISDMFSQTARLTLPLLSSTPLPNTEAPPQADPLS